LNCALLGLSLAVALSLLAGCGGVTITNPDFYAAITAPGSSVRVTQTMQMTRTSEAAGPLTYSVNGVVGGNAQFGTIDSNGLYTAPAVVPVPDSVTITSTATNYPSYPPGKAAIAVWNPIPTINTVTPSGFSEGTTTVVVDGAQFVYGAQIIWNGAAVPTTLNSDSELVRRQFLERFP
jgi:hypothetical protein